LEFFQEKVVECNINSVTTLNSPRIINDKFLSKRQCRTASANLGLFDCNNIDPFYLICCPALNAQNFAVTLLKNEVAMENLDVEDAARLYKFFIQELTKEMKDTVSYNKKIASVVNIFKDMYKGIVSPIMKSTIA
jgi:hypothetical protein